MNRAVRSFLPITCWPLLMIGLSVGCGESGNSQQARDVASPAGNVDQEESSEEKRTGGESTGSKSVANEVLAEQVSKTDAFPDGTISRDATGRQWIGDVPLDVWFDDPLTVAGEGAVLSGDPPNRDSSDELASATKGIHSPNVIRNQIPVEQSGKRSREGETNTIDWNSLIPADVLDGEVKSIRNALVASLQSVGKYNAKYQDVQVAAGTLAAIAAIAEQHPDDSLRWKLHAASLRGLAREIEEAAAARGGTAQKRAKALLQSIVELLDGNNPAGLPVAVPEIPFAETLERSSLMKRMDQSAQWLRKSMISEEVLKDQAEKAQHEAAILAAFAQVIALDGFPSADEPEFADYAKQLETAAREMVSHARGGDFPAFEQARQNMQKKCNECHSDYR